MTLKEKLIKATIELAIVEGRIEELKRSKTYLSSSTYYRNRLIQLEDKAEKLESFIENGGNDETQEFKLTFRVPQDLFKGSSKPEEILHYLKKEWLEVR